MTQKPNKEPFPGWRYLEEYSALIQVIQNEYPGFFPALLEAQQAYREATEVPSTIILREYPTDDELYEQGRKITDTIEPKIAMKNANTQIGRPRLNKETQTCPQTLNKRIQTSILKNWISTKKKLKMLKVKLNFLILMRKCKPAW